MAEFKYRAALKSGQIIRGIITSTTRTNALEKLKSNNLQTIYIKKISRSSRDASTKEAAKKGLYMMPGADRHYNVKGRKVGEGRKRNIADYLTPVKPKDVVVFTNNLYLLKKANFHNTQALEVLMETTEHPVFKDIIEDIMIGVDSGLAMNTIMAYYPKVFPPLYTNIIKVGEETGSLTLALEQAREYIETSTTFNKKIKWILIPRIFQLIMILVLLVVGLLAGVPMIQTVYDMFGSKAQIPVATQVAVNVVEFILEYWYVWAILIGLGFLAFFLFYNTPMGKYKVDRFILKIPVLGRLFVNINTEKFFNALLLNLRNGVRVQESLATSQSVIKNTYILGVIEAAKANISAGDSWVQPFEESGLFPKMTIEMLNVGMQTDIVEILEKVNEYTKAEVDDATQAFIKALPEITYLIVGVLLIFFVITVLIPIVQVYMGDFLYDMA